MKTKSSFLLPALIAVLNLLTAGRLTAQTFTVLKSFGILTNVSGFNPQSTLVQGLDGTLYGTATYGDASVEGTVFKVQPDGSGFTVLKWFTNSIEGANPYAGLALSVSVLYGTTANGGTSNLGTLFKVNADGTGYTVLKHFNGGDGAHPYYAGLILANSVLYGATYSGGSSNFGTVFKVNTDGTGYVVLKNFTGSNGANPNAAMTFSNGVLYGTTEKGGAPGAGTVFKLNTDGTGYTLLHNFTDAPDGAYPDAVLTLSGGVLYGTTYNGGTYSGNLGGTLFKLNTDGTGYAVLKSFDFDEINPSGPLALSGGVLYGTASGGGWVNGAAFKINTDGTAYTVLWNFTNYSPNGATPYAGLMLSGTVLYGTAARGGSSGRGTVFKLNTDGTGYTVLKNFAYSDGRETSAGITLSGGVLYGATYSGGSSDSGTVFKLNTDGTGYAVLKDLANSDGRYSFAGLVLSDALYGTGNLGGSSDAGTLFKINTDGTGFTVLINFAYSGGAGPTPGLASSGSALYGTTSSGGDSNYGTVFKINTDGTSYAVLKNFSGVNGDGAYPSAGLRLSDSTLYGTTSSGGASNYGTVFKINTDGTGYTVLKNFAGSGDGANPQSFLALSGSVLYGTTLHGGGSDQGTVFKINTDGTDYTVLKTFSSSDGAAPYAGLTLSGGTLYGTTYSGGISSNGTVFAINTDGTSFTTLYNFTGGSDGAAPLAGLILSGNTLYGTASGGGSSGAGTVFSLSFRPQLTITPSGTNVILSWPTGVAGFSYAGYYLEETANLDSPTGWSVSDFFPPVIDNGQIRLTGPMRGPQRYYRLRKP